MTVLEAVRHRRSIREFKDRPLPEKAVDALIEALRWAPSAGNLQSRKFFFVLKPETKRRLAVAALSQNFIARAPLVVVGCADSTISSRYGDRGVQLYGIQDAAASIMSMMLAAEENGLGSVWVGAFREPDVSEILNLHDNLRPVAIVPIGYPAETPRPTSRKSREEIVEWVI